MAKIRSRAKLLIYVRLATCASTWLPGYYQTTSYQQSVFAAKKSTRLYAAGNMPLRCPKTQLTHVSSGISYVGTDFAVYFNEPLVGNLHYLTVRQSVLETISQENN